METLRNWYVVNTKFGCEKKVADLLEKKNIKCYFPTTSHSSLYHGKVKVHYSSLFPDIVFAYANEYEHVTIKKTEGVTGILFWLQKPAIVSEKEIDALQNFLRKNNDIKMEKISIKSYNALQRNIPNLLIENDTPTVSIDGIQKVYLHSLGYAVYTTTVKNERKIKSVA